MKNDKITCAYGFDKLTPTEQRLFKDFLRVLEAIKAEPLYPTFSKEEKARMFKRIQKEIKDESKA